jgi:protein-S-isoprenylcysteine O-methyltransferase Ste14
MTKLSKIILTVLMVVVWFVMFIILIPMKSSRGQWATVAICLLINGGLAVLYSCIGNRPATFREWLKR